MPLLDLLEEVFGLLRHYQVDLKREALNAEELPGAWHSDPLKEWERVEEVLKSLSSKRIRL